ncbi:alpha-(1-_3)-arabinofuranosyltransferase domain-containing protein [Corynebacterium flavescens]|uniref:alpha-(1->3)-arabinofuranosyltransferase domain-containing protein n=1 Tax=Corynebacterium flavescens TaxID=28028 RepID=UPI003FD22D3C
MPRNSRGWRRLSIAFLALVVVLQPWGKVAADTKLDLVANPAGFLAGAFTIYSDNFPLGQLQNQAYGYLFPQGPFFLLLDPLPDWIAQRLWWFVVLVVGFCGFQRLTQALGMRGLWPTVAALLFALSPRALTTLTAISSETWPVMLAPWVILPFLRERLDWRSAAAAVIPVACMGAVNATATIAACLPAALILIYRRAWRPGVIWLAGCAAVSAWWLVPLFILGRYSPPFTEFIESSYVTTRWLNLPEILRGTTSWAPFVDTERVAGNALATQPVFILVTMAVAAIGIYGLAKLPRVWALMALVGIAILGTHATWYLDALDGPLAALRNLHKFDPLVRIPLLLGFARALAGIDLPRTLHPSRRQAVGVAVILLVVSALAPALSGRLLPRGAYEKVPEYWHQAADFINANAQGTRTLIYPPASFARQDWGWTRDEPAQPLLEVPWAVRDAIPLVPPEAIRGLDGVMDALEQDPSSAPQVLARLGIGAIILRHDLENSGSSHEPNAADFGGQVHTFGEVDVVTLNNDSMALSESAPLRVAGGGESLAFLDAVAGPAVRELVDSDAQIVTDTPTLSDRNYGTLDGALSAPLATDDPSTVHNRLRDYPSSGPLSVVESTGAQVVASSSAADANAFGGAQPRQSVTAAVDGENSTSWWPAPGDTGWIELRGHFSSPRLNIMATSQTTVTVRSGSAAVEVELEPYHSEQVRVPGGDTEAIRVELSERVGIANLEVEGTPIERVLTVPDTSPNVQQFFFQQIFQDSRVLIRDFTAPRPMEVKVDSPKPVLVDGVLHHPGDTLELSPGQHRVRSTGAWVSLQSTSWSPPQDYRLSGPEIAAADSPRLLVTGRAFNEGLQGFLGDTPLVAREVDAATQAFEIPAGQAGTFRMSFVAQPWYFAALVFGGALGLLTLGLCLLSLRRRSGWWQPAQGSRGLVALVVLALLGWQALVAGLCAWAIVRWTTIPAPALAGGLVAIAGAMLARAPWPSGSYAGDSDLLLWLCAAALACLEYPTPARRLNKDIAHGSNHYAARHRKHEHEDKIGDLAAKERDTREREDER